MSMPTRNPRVLFVTPEISYVPQEMGDAANYLKAKAGGLGDVSALLAASLLRLGADVHLAILDYRSVFNVKLPPRLKRDLPHIMREVPDDRIHLAEDRAFFHLNGIYPASRWENTKTAVAFQREVINHIVPRVSARPDPL
jgi:starch synthase